MATRPDFYEYERRVEDLMNVYRQAQRTIIAQINAAILAGNLNVTMQRRLQLAAVLSTLDQLGAETDPQARRLVADAYHQGAGKAATQISGPQVRPVDAGNFASVSVDAVRALEDSIMGRLDDTRRTVGRRVNDVFAKAGRRAGLRATLGSDGSPQTAARQMARELRRDGITSFVDKAGRRWTLENYTEMAVRTITREAVVQGAVDRMASHGINLARISIHAGSCEVCRPYEGRLVDLGGGTTSYQGEAVMDASLLPPFHPRCRHSLAPVATGVEDFIRTGKVAVA